MDALSFYGLERTDDPHRWVLPVELRLCSGLGALFGGCGLGSCIEVLEQTTGRPVVWASAQFLSYARPGARMAIRVIEAVRGHQVSQARAVATVEGEEILTVNAALGTRDLDLSGSWAEMPKVAPPDDCPPRQIFERHRGTIIDELDMRLADGRGPDELEGEPGSGRSALWVRVPDFDLTHASLLAIFGDYVPFGIGQALGTRAGGNSLDNSLRIAHRRRTDWVLADIRVHAVEHGFGHGLVHLWSDDGMLLGTASQSTIVRRWREDHSDVQEGNS